MKCIHNGKIIHEGKVLLGKAILFTDKIGDIVDGAEVLDKGYELIDAKGSYIAAGFVDIHIHGYNGVDTMDGTEEAIEVMSKGIAENGVTSFLPTTMSMSKEAITKALDAIKSIMYKGSVGAEVVGTHMEGPYFNLAFKGAQNPDYIVNPAQEDIDFVKSYQDVVKLVTLSPEIEGALEFIKTITKDTQITLSMGHSGATYEEAMKGIEAGISHTTHLFNGMSPLHHRNPGVAGTALATEVSCEMICDTIHVNKGLFPLVIKAKGPDKFVLVTDCMCAGGCKPGEYSLGGQKVTVDETSARLMTDGTLAGSILRLNVALKNIVENTTVPVEEAIRYVTINPATVIKVNDKKGTLDKGKDADIVLFDEKIEVQLTIGKGNIIYEKVSTQ